MTMGINCVNFSFFLLCIVFAVSSETTNDTSSVKCGPKETWTVYMDLAADVIDKAKNSLVSFQYTAGNSVQKETLMTYLEVAVEMIKKAKVKFSTGDGNTLPQHKNRQSFANLGCSDLLRMGYTRSGVYTISTRIKLTEKKVFDVYCDMETDGGGWTVIQRRGDFQNPVDYFYKDWERYKEGFGYLEKEFWLGNDNIYALTNQEIYSARFDLVDVKGNTVYALYDVFRIDDEDSQYTLHISNYSGNAGGDSMEKSNNQKFSTRDQDNDVYEETHCAEKYKGGWWFHSCFNAYLNGENIKGETSNFKGNHWYHWKGNYDESLAKTEIKIRPKNRGV